jgi:hypothetical protein
VLWWAVQLVWGKASETSEFGRRASQRGITGEPGMRYPKFKRLQDQLYGKGVVMWGNHLCQDQDD